MSVAVGGARIDRVEEQQFEVLVTYLTDDLDFIERRIRPLPSGFLDPETMGFEFTY